MSNSFARFLYAYYQHKGLVGLLLGATEYAKKELGSVSIGEVLNKYNTGDIVTAKDRCVHESVVKYFKEVGIGVKILGEEGVSDVKDPEFALLIDELEGTQNSINALPHGINMAIARYKPRLRFKDLESAVVTNLYDGRMFVGERGDGAYKIVEGKRVDFDETKNSDLWEVPCSRSYTTTDNQRKRQEMLANIFFGKFGNQCRSVDSTGTMLVEVADRNRRAYGDWRNATKCWDVLPSALIIQEAGFVFTDCLGFDLSEAVFYNENNPDYDKDGGLNRRVGENFIVADRKDHCGLIFGPGSTWNILLNVKSPTGPEYMYPIDMPDIECESPATSGIKKVIARKMLNLMKIGLDVAERVVSTIQDAKLAYGALVPADVRDKIIGIGVYGFGDYYSRDSMRNSMSMVCEETLFPDGVPMHWLGYAEYIRKANIM